MTTTDLAITRRHARLMIGGDVVLATAALAAAGAHLWLPDRAASTAMLVALLVHLVFRTSTDWFRSRHADALPDYTGRRSEVVRQHAVDAGWPVPVAVIADRVAIGACFVVLVVLVLVIFGY